jgi:cellulose synthase/poly-beta-1,6-N-acetylglucosamine synthase-like glycosyltransferase
MLDFIVDSLFILSVAFIWFMIAYQFVLTVAGYLHFISSQKEKAQISKLLQEGLHLPLVSVLVPARNEERVIKKTVKTILNLDYPKDQLELIVINDDSNDRTGEILESLSQEDSRLRVITIPTSEGGKGKSRVLNTAVKQARGGIIAVYDADNRPEKDALKYLVAVLQLNPELGGVLGKFRCKNKDKNLLTRFINIEGVGFQNILQAGRWKLLGVSTFPGTNFVIHKELLQELGGWDESALAEDSELSIRVYQAGKRIKFIPYSVTWEQEPQSLAVWLRQRTRWVRGNNYVLWKFLKEIPTFSSKVLALELLYSLSLYYIFLFAVVFSDLIFLLGLTGIWNITLLGPFTLVWGLGYLLFILELFLALSFDGEDSLKNLLLVLLSYFTYCQGWLVVVFKAIWQDLRGVSKVWAKTERV